MRSAGCPFVTGILALFLVLDAVVGLGGRYDLTVGASLTAEAPVAAPPKGAPAGGPTSPSA